MNDGTERLRPDGHVGDRDADDDRGCGVRAGGRAGARGDVMLSAAIGVWMLVAALAWLTYAHLHGFDPGLCRSYGGCRWSV